MTLAAFHYSLAAGDAAFRLFAASEAAAYYEAARKLLVTNPGLADVEEAACRHLYTKLGRALEPNSQFEEAAAVYEELEDLAEQRAAPALKMAALMAQITLNATLSQSSRSILGRDPALIEKAQALAQEMGDQAAEIKIWQNLSNIYAARNDFAQAATAGEQALALARQHNLREQMAFTLNDLGSRCYQAAGKLNRAKAVLQEAAGLWREQGNLPMLADSLSGLCSLHILTGHYGPAVTFFEKAADISQRIGNLWGQSYCRYRVGQAYWEQGRPDQAIAVMEDSIRLSQSAGFLAPQIITRADLALVYGGLGARQRALECAQEAMKLAGEQSPLRQRYSLGILAQLNTWFGYLAEAEALIAQGKKDVNHDVVPIYAFTLPMAEVDLALRQGNNHRAVEASNGLLAQLRQFDMQSQLPRVLYLQGQAWAALGQVELARERLATARAAAEVMGSELVLWQILALLSQIEPNSAKGKHLQQQAQEIVDSIADRLANPQLRASFLDLVERQLVKDPKIALIS